MGEQGAVVLPSAADWAFAPSLCEQLDEVGQLNTDLVDQQPGPFCPAPTQLSGLRNTGVFCYCTFLFIPSAAWAYTAVMQLLLSLT